MREAQTYQRGPLSEMVERADLGRKPMPSRAGLRGQLQTCWTLCISFMNEIKTRNRNSKKLSIWRKLFPLIWIFETVRSRRLTAYHCLHTLKQIPVYWLWADGNNNTLFPFCEISIARSRKKLGFDDKFSLHNWRILDRDWKKLLIERTPLISFLPSGSPAEKKK